MSQATAPRTRRDAVRNRVLVLQAARKVFSQRGGDASLEEVATRAGVGVGTVHRAFGSRAQLVDALFQAELDDVAAYLQECAEAETGWEALCQVLWGLTERQLLNRGLHDLVLGQVADPGDRVRLRLEPVLQQVVERARQEGRVRADFAASDIAMLSRAVSASRSGSSERDLQMARRHVLLLLKGIVDSPDELPVPGPVGKDEPWVLRVPGPAGGRRRTRSAP